MAQHLHEGRKNHLWHWLIQLDESDLAALYQGLEALNRIVQTSFLPESDKNPCQDEQHNQG